MRRIALVVGIGLFLLTACSSGDLDNSTRDDGGTIVEGGEVGVSNLRVGDCVRIPTTGEGSADLQGEVSSFQAVPCEEEHEGEVVLNEETFFQDGEFPGEDVVFAGGQERCVSALESYTGQAYSASPYGVVVLIPTEELWVDGELALTCVGTTLTDDNRGLTTTKGSIAAQE